MIIFPIYSNNKIQPIDFFKMDMDMIDQGGIDSILFYYETYGDKIEQHIPDKYIDEFYKRKIKEKTK